MKFQKGEKVENVQALHSFGEGWGGLAFLLSVDQQRAGCSPADRTQASKCSFQPAGSRDTYDFRL
jgi:hypothetical protein